ncbi:DNA mismatch repair protein Mlh3-like [Haliotis cracherodii]|uniref:DNA mismatch repair protein Mlh3-like n=1 Tax=Haliotis cracherodii TaxID=6455 RepID=UPI0039E7C268
MIRQLSDEVQSHLRSGVAITSLTQCVEELVMNALDAGASCIAVRVDLPCCKIQAVDNGQGISRDQLEKVGERYSTSKCHELEDLNNLQYFGYRGEAIASIRDTAAVLEINSRTSRFHQTYCKMFQKGVAQAVSESVIPRPSIGTTVTAHDLFYSLPVRKKNMNEALELERIRYRVEGIALIHPSVSFSLRNDITGNILLQTQKSSSMLKAFMHLFGTGKSKCLREVSLQKDCFDVEGFIGKEGHSSKSLQFVYVNGRLVLKTKVHKILNHVLRRSLVLKRKGSNNEDSLGTTQTAGPKTSSPPKQGDKYAMFVINVKCPLDAYDITFDPAKTLVEFKDWTVLTDGIDGMVMEFLKKENLVSVSDLSVVSPVTLPDESSQTEALKVPDSGDRAQQGGADPQETELGMNQTIDASDPEATVKDYTENISTLNTSNCLFSKRVRRHRDVMAIRRNQFFQDESLKNKKDDDLNSENTLELATEVKVITGTPLLHAQNSSDRDISHKNDICTEKSAQTLAQIPVPGKLQKPPEKNLTLHSSESIYDAKHETKPVDLLTGTVTGSQCVDGNEAEDEDISEEPMQLPESLPENTTASNPWDDSEDPLPSTLRASLTKMKSKTSVQDQVLGWSNVETHRKALICLPDSPPSASTSGIHKLQNLRFISPKSKYSAAEKMCKRLGFPSLSRVHETRSDERHAQKSAAQKISERLVLNAKSAAGKKIISAKLQKFKNTTGASGDQASKPSEPSVGEGSGETGGPETSIVSEISAMTKVCHDNVPSSFTQLRKSPKTIILPSHETCPALFYSEQIADKHAFVTDVPSSSSGLSISAPQDKPVLSTSVIQHKPLPSVSKSAAEQFVNERNPVVPTVADIEYLTSRSEYSARKRFNPFALSTSAKLSKLAKRSCVDDSNVKTSSNKEFLSSSSFVETPASVFKNSENIISDKTENKVEALVDTAIPEQLDLPTFHADVDANGSNLVTSSGEKTFESSDLHQNVACERGRAGRTLLPFTSYSDRLCDRVDDSAMPDYLDVSETESVDSVILPHVDICSPEVSDQEGGSPPSYCTQSFQPTGLSSQGFTLDVKANDEDCQSGGFSPNVDRITPMTGSPSSPSDKTEYVHETLSGLTDVGSVTGEEEDEVTDPDLPDSSFSVVLPFGTSCWNKEKKSGDSESELTLAGICTITSTKPSYLYRKKEDDLATESPSLSLPHSTFEDCPDFNSLTCGQRSPHQADSTQLTNTDDSFPLRKLLLGDSLDNEIQIYGRAYSDDVNETVGPDKKTKSPCQQSQSNVNNSNIDVIPAEDILNNLNEIDKSLAKEFDNEMSDDFVESREITLGGIHEGACSSSQCDREQSCDSSCGPVSDLTIGSRDLGSSCSITGDTDDQPSYSSSGMHIQTVRKPTWSNMEDPKTGKTIYVNSLTGNTMFEDQWKECGYESDGDIDEGTGTLIVRDDPVPLSPSDRQKLQNLLDCHLVAETSDDQVKWRKPPSTGKDKAQQDEQHSLEDLFSSWNNPVMEVPQQSCLTAEVAHMSRAGTRSFKSLYPTKFTKTMLKSFQVLGQVDNKFIACVLKTEEQNTSKAPDLIVLFDQHAAHERVRLEQLTEDIYVNSADVTDCSIKPSQVSPPRTLTFTEENVRLIKSFRDEFKRIGVTFTINGSSRNSLNIHSIPACLVEREANEVRRGRESVVMDIVESLIKDHLEVLKMMGGARSRLPQAIHKVLCSQACHGAIKFGDSLTLSQCRELLESLSECDLPFQCAHGRPSVMPLLSLQQLQAKVPPEKTKRPSLWKISRHLSIHQ